MNKTLIPWVKNPDGSQGYTLNSKTGCLNHTPEGLCFGGMFPCYAYKLANGRLRARYLANKNIVNPIVNPDGGFPIGYSPYQDPFYPRFWPERLAEPCHLGKGQFGLATRSRGIFLDDMSDWMGDYWPGEWTEQELQMMRDCPQHRIYTLTKQPQNLSKWSPFPDNCWVGVTVTSNTSLSGALERLRFVDAKVKYISFEPLLGEITGYDGCDLAYLLEDSGIDCGIIGACTGSYIDMVHLSRQTRQEQDFDSIKQLGNKWTLQPPIEWVEEIVRACDKAGTPVFLKDNLKPLLDTLDITGASYGRLTSLDTSINRQGYRKREWYQLRQEMPK
ncbi:hypothetical protein ES705_12501 [subsurface metagenome]